MSRHHRKSSRRSFTWLPYSLLCLFVFIALSWSFWNIGLKVLLSPTLMHEAFHEDNKISTPILPVKSVDLEEDVQAGQYNDPWKSQIHRTASDLSIKQEFVESPIIVRNEDKSDENMSTSPIGFGMEFEPSIDLERDYNVESNKNQSSRLVSMKELTSPEPKVSSPHLDRDLVPDASHHVSTYTSHQGFSNVIDHDGKVVNMRINSIDAPYHDQTAFKEDFNKMLPTFKIFVYPHNLRNDPFSNIFAPMDGEPTGNYASENYFKKSLFNSDFITRNASEAHMFYLPFSITKLRHDKRVGVQKLDTFVSSYMERIRQKWPYWNRTSGADHFFVSCHSITKLVSDKVVYLRRNAIQVVCSSNVFVQGYVPHKDISMPQVWPRKGTPSNAKLIDQRKALAFFAGAANSPTRAELVKAWSRDKDILVYSKRISTPYSRALLTSKFCLHVKGYEVNTARIADAMHFGCVPVILANHYDLPYSNILDWNAFSLVVEASDIPLLKQILQEVSPARYKKLQKNVMSIRKHFQWNSPPREYDAFYMVMYELWTRRHVLRPLNLKTPDD